MAEHDHPTNPAVRLTDGAFYGDDPHPHLRWMREHAPVYWDAAGNVWSINNWKPLFDVDASSNPGGDGIVIFVGVATPRSP